MLVQDVMVKDVRTTKVDEPIRTVAAIICTTKFNGVPVVDEENRLIGFVSEKDILNAMLPSYADYLNDPVRSRDFEGMEECYPRVLSKSVKELMTHKVITVHPEDPLLMAASRMTLRGFRRLPVVDADNRLVGMVSLGDIHKAIFKRELGI
ncbi:MAG: CBS domain-containing protein [Magnetococcales bacterium]|nr:CBS domain-containing protein [Magnetococcales bacterium]